jgi:hypothetical protein
LINRFGVLYRNAAGVESRDRGKADSVVPSATAVDSL